MDEKVTNAAAQDLERFLAFLKQSEKSRLTLEKYRRDNLVFLRFCAGRPLDKMLVLEYKRMLRDRYKTASVNSMLAATNHFLKFLGREDCRVEAVKVQHRLFCEEREALDKEEYRRLLHTARRRGDRRLYLILQTLCGTGIRVSELAYITVRAARAGRAVVECKNKQRVILIPKPLQTHLLRYSVQKGIKSGPLFTEKDGAAFFIKNTGTPLEQYRWKNIILIMSHHCGKCGKNETATGNRLRFTLCALPCVEAKRMGARRRIGGAGQSAGADGAENSYTLVCGRDSEGETRSEGRVSAGAARKQDQRIRCGALR